LLLGALRINPRRPRLEAYVAVPGLSRDVYVEGDAARNRALEGDVVAIESLRNFLSQTSSFFVCGASSKWV